MKGKPTCHYCGGEAKLVGGEVVYPHRPDLYKLRFWLCDPCDAFVGVHKNSPHNAPFGSLAKRGLRKLRSKAHAIFDPMWKTKCVTRKKAYKLLADKLGVRVEDCHISHFNVEQCEDVIRLCSEIYEEAGITNSYSTS